MAYAFDYTTQLIHITNPQIEVDIQELINVIRTQEATEQGITYSKIANASGKENLGGSVSVGITVELLEWQIKFWEGNYIARVSGGNLVGGVGNDPIAYSAGVQTLLIQSAASTVVQVSTGSGLSAEQDEKLMSLADAAAIANQVWTEENRGGKLDFIHAVDGGKWTIVGNQMVFFESDNMTEIARFNLYDSAGNPTIENVMTRERV